MLIKLNGRKLQYIMPSGPSHKFSMVYITYISSRNADVEGVIGM